MLRFLGFIGLCGACFVAGYYAGQRPVSELKRSVYELTGKVASLSRNAVDTTLGFERSLRWHQGLVDAKSKLVQAKAEVLDRNYGNAAKELGEASEYLERVQRSGDNPSRNGKVKPLLDKMRSTRAELAAGKPVPRANLDELQKELDSLLEQ